MCPAQSSRSIWEVARIRYLVVHPRREEKIARIELVKGPDAGAPIVMAVALGRPGIAKVAGTLRVPSVRPTAHGVCLLLHRALGNEGGKIIAGQGNRALQIFVFVLFVSFVVTFLTTKDTKSTKKTQEDANNRQKCAKAGNGPFSYTAQKNPHLCRVNAFENPLLSVGTLCLGFGSHCKVGLQAPNKKNRLPAGTP